MNLDLCFKKCIMFGCISGFDFSLFLSFNFFGKLFIGGSFDHNLCLLLGLRGIFGGSLDLNHNVGFNLLRRSVINLSSGSFDNRLFSSRLFLDRLLIDGNFGLILFDILGNDRLSVVGEKKIISAVEQGAVISRNFVMSASERMRGTATTSWTIISARATTSWTIISARASSWTIESATWDNGTTVATAARGLDDHLRGNAIRSLEDLDNLLGTAIRCLDNLDNLLGTIVATASR